MTVRPNPLALPVGAFVRLEADLARPARVVPELAVLIAQERATNATRCGFGCDDGSYYAPESAFTHPDCGVHMAGADDDRVCEACDGPETPDDPMLECIGDFPGPDVHVGCHAGSCTSRSCHAYNGTDDALEGL